MAKYQDSNYRRFLRSSGRRFYNMMKVSNTTKPTIIEFLDNLIECKRMHARVLSSFCGTHPNCKGCIKGLV